ncbi:DUF2304 family protein [Caminibacter pacificus]|jgi:hypothetical protein
MILIKTVLIAILSIAFVLFAFSNKQKHFQKIVVFLGYFVLFVFIIKPKWSDTVANFFGIETGAALIVYLSIALLSLISVIIYVNQKKQNEAITKIVREMGIKDAKKC